MRLYVYNRNEGCRAVVDDRAWCLWVGEHATTVLKGWWQLGPSSINRHFEIEIALGGEDNMLQFGVVLPFVLRWHIGVRVPRKLTSAWIYERREWTVRVGYVGRWLDLMFASDEHMRDTGMDDYYWRKRANPDCANCGHYKGFHQNDERRCITLSEVNHGCAPCTCPGYAPAKLVWTRAALWPGWHLEVRPRLIDRVFGRRECITTEGEPEPVVVRQRGRAA